MTVQASPQRPSSARFGGLDGLRAIAVGLVLVYHFWPALLPGGFLGVDVFFTISGFLITSLLLREFDAHGRISLGSFWRRRARRLLPALALVLLVCTSIAALIGGDVLVNIAKQIGGAALFVSNWVYIAMGADYFARDNPELYRNTWSLSIEEQFYVVLPLLLVLLFRARRGWLRTLVLLLLGIASAVWMLLLSQQGGEATRIYFGSDTHTFGLFLGAAAAALLHRNASRLDTPRDPRTGFLFATLRFMRQFAYIVLALGGLAVLGWLTFRLTEGSAESFQGGFQLATLAALLTIAAVTRPGAWAGRALDIWPLRWIGERSYGIYLWHWPLLILLGAAFGASLPPWAIGLITLIITVVVAALSYTFVEQPIRLLGLRATAKKFFSFKMGTARSRAVSVTLAALLIITIPTTAYAVATAPSMSSAAEAIARGQAALDEQAETADADTSATSDADATAASDGDGSACAPAENDTKKSGAEETTSKNEETPQADSDAAAGAKETAAAGSDKKSTGQTSTGATSTDKASTGKTSADKANTDAQKDVSSEEDCSDEAHPPIALEGQDITAIGDSVMLASLPELTEAFPGISVDAAVSRGVGAGVGIARTAADAGSMRRVLVVGLGTNGTVSWDELEQLHELADDRLIVLVNAYGERDWIPGVNQELANFAASYRGVVVADWQGSVTGVPDALAGDEIHPNPSGGVIYAASVQQALEALQQPGEALGYALPRR